MTWEDLDWPTLDRLRGKFLNGPAPGESYWRSERDLASYDLTYGERIGWKWDAVLHELHLRGWSPPPGPLLDWGCGSGVAGRRVIEAFGRDSFTSLRVHDHSPLACNFAITSAQEKFSGLDADVYRDGGPVGLLVLSHVLNELDDNARKALATLIARSTAVIWVEPGTHVVSRDLISWREPLLDSHHVIAPCTHAAACGLLAPGRERDWCHHFAKPPLGIHADSNWVRFGQRAGIDLRSLPYSFLVLERKGVRPAPAPLPPEAGRILGRPEHYKPYVRLYNCSVDGVNQLTVPKRTAPDLYKHLERANPPLIYRWVREGNEVRGGEPLAQPLTP